MVVLVVAVMVVVVVVVVVVVMMVVLVLLTVLVLVVLVLELVLRWCSGCWWCWWFRFILICHVWFLDCILDHGQGRVDAIAFQCIIFTNAIGRLMGNAYHECYGTQVY